MEDAPGSSSGFGLSAREQEAPKPGRGELREDWMATHPTPVRVKQARIKLTRMMSLDVADSACVYAAFLVYLDLLEARNWYEVSYIGLAEFQLVCLRGREREADDLQVVVPTPVHVSFNHERLRQIMKRTHTVSGSPMSVTLAVVESDSTIVYYKLTDGFVVPDLPDSSEDMDNKQWRKKRKRHSR